MSSHHRVRDLCAVVVTSLAAAGCGDAGVTSTTSGGAAGTSSTTGGGGVGGTLQTGTGGTGTGTGGTGGTTGGNPPFSLDAHTAVTPEKALALTTNLPAKTGDCGAAPFEGTPCADLDQDGLADAWEEYDLLPPFVNAGEEAHPLVSDLTMIGFPGDDAWAAQDFCGGLGGSGCSAPVREKLLVDPFGP